VVARTKSVSEINKTMIVANFNEQASGNLQFHKSDPNLVSQTSIKKDKKKDRERRKSITKFITDIFTKKKDCSMTICSSRGFLSKISPRTKNKSKVHDVLYIFKAVEILIQKKKIKSAYIDNVDSLHAYERNN